MTKLTMSVILLASAAVAVPLLAQSTPSDLSDLVGARGAGGETQLEARGYRHIKTETSADSKYSYWWNDSRRACVSVRTFDGRYAAIVATLPFDCGMSGGGNDRPGNRPGRLPGGSWNESCVAGRMVNSVLYAQCTDRNGRRVNTSINMRTCPSKEVRNTNGRLTCIGAGPAPARLPGGSWNQSCVAGRMVGSTLYAQCEDRNGRRVNSSINMRQCPSNLVRNSNGQLTCMGNGYGADRMPGGSWAQSCRNTEIRNGILYATCDNGNGSWVPAKITLGQCYGDRVKNDYGRLICE